MKNYVLEDIEKRSAESPDSFIVPDYSIRNNLSKGDIVKLIFIPILDKPVAAERLWVKVVSREGNEYMGKVDNDPEYVDGLKSGDLVFFEARNVSDVWEDF